MIEHTDHAHDWACPPFCSPGLCHAGQADLEHREVPEVAGVVPSASGTALLTLAVERDDELDRDAARQIEHPVHYALGVGSEVVWLTAVELDEYVRSLLALRARGEQQDR